jgi:hypothetical protein
MVKTKAEFSTLAQGVANQIPTVCRMTVQYKEGHRAFKDASGKASPLQYRVVVSDVDKTASAEQLKLFVPKSNLSLTEQGGLKEHHKGLFITIGRDVVDTFEFDLEVITDNDFAFGSFEQFVDFLQRYRTKDNRTIFSEATTTENIDWDNGDFEIPTHYDSGDVKSWGIAIQQKGVDQFLTQLQHDFTFQQGVTLLRDDTTRMQWMCLCNMVKAYAGLGSNSRTNFLNGWPFCVKEAMDSLAFLVAELIASPDKGKPYYTENRKLAHNEVLGEDADRLAPLRLKLEKKRIADAKKPGGKKPGGKKNVWCTTCNKSHWPGYCNSSDPNGKGGQPATTAKRH